MSAQQKRKKQKKVKVLFNENNYQHFVSLIQQSKLPYTIIRSNYTLEINSSFLNIYFMQEEMSKKAMICGQMIKKDLSICGIEMPEIERDQLKYFDFNYEKIIHSHDGYFFNIDIKSAYATALKQLISPKTFSYLCSLPKKDRLAAVGMLASRKDLFFYDPAGVCVNHEKQVKETADWFYYCVLEIQKLMDDIIALIGTDFLFYWVDGIFFRTLDNRDKIEAYLKEKGYENSFDQCFNFKYYENGNTKHISYKKFNENGNHDFKILHLPKLNKDVDKYLFKLLNIIKL